MFRKISFLFLFLPTFLFGQDGTITKADSLLQLVDKAKDSEKINILIELSEEFRENEKGLEYAIKALEVAVKLDNNIAQADALFAIGRYYYENADDKNALEYYFQSLPLYQKTQDKIKEIKTLINIGRSYFWLDSLDQSREFAQKAFDIAKEIDNKLEQAEALLILADVLDKEYNNQAALNKILEALELVKEVGNPNDLTKVYNALGKQYFSMGEYQNSIENYLKEIDIKELENDKRGLALSHHMLGRTHRTIGNFQLALEQFQKSLSLSEEIGDMLYIASNSSEIGLIYESLSRSPLAVEENEQNYQRSLSYHDDALKIYRNLGDNKKIAEALNNIANINSLLTANQFVAKFGEFWEDSLAKISSNEILQTYGKALENYNQALEIFQEENITQEIINVNINVAAHYIYAREWTKANQHLNKALKLARETNSQFHIALILYNFGEYFYRLNNFESAKQNLLQSLALSSNLGIKSLMQHTHQKLGNVYEDLNNLPEAIKHIKSYNRVKDEIFSEESQKIITEMQTKYETEKKEQEIKLLNNERELQHAVIQRQKLTLVVTIGGLVVFLAFAVLLINMVRQKQRANRILEEKNELISHQKQEITDSIRYASRIQTAILPSPTILADALKEHFVLFLPRDIVSGDFYWFTKLQNKMILVAADCTGHGVPGAFMSMLGVSFLYEIVNKEGVMQPSKILDMLREFVKLTLSQTGKKDEQKDGMDISLSMLDMENMKLEWAGAYNPLILIRNDEIIEYKADKMPVAIHITDHKPFTNHKIDLQPNDVFYMFSDGFPDQFGGDDGRKFMSKRFKQLLLDIHHKPMEEQKEILHKEHLDWRGNMEQIDDIVVLGVRV